MEPNVPSQPDLSDDHVAQYAAATRQWLAGIPLHRRISAKIGLQGKFIIAFALMLLATLSGSYWLYISQGRNVVSYLLGEQALQISRTLAMSVEPAVDDRDVKAMQQIAREMIARNGVVTVAFFNASGNPVVVACKDARLNTAERGFLPQIQNNAAQLLQVVHRTHPLLGNYAEVTAPILRALPAGSLEGPGTTEPLRATGSSRRVVGYVMVGLAEDVNWARMEHVSLLLSSLGALVFVLSLPVVYVVVHRIFLPIRQLVLATQRIAAGDLSVRVEIHRPDDIGHLARSFNDMVLTVTQHRRQLATANEQLVEANRDLEDRISQRTMQLETANRRLSSEIAEKEDFLRAVSHDLNAPLRNISGMASMLLLKYREKMDEDITHRLERIQKNVEVETELIAELLELSRIKTRRQKMETIDLDKMVRDLGDIFENDLRSKQIALVFDTPLPAITGEKARLRQVFQNLIDNAVKYMGDGSAPEASQAAVKEIHIGCSVGRDEAEFYVSDTGIGIDRDDIDKVFFVFRRGRNSAAQHVTGKGVGLASVKSIIETYNGSIWVESERKHGSTFRFTINGKFVAFHCPIDRPGSKPAAVGKIGINGKGSSAGTSAAPRAVA